MALSCIINSDPVQEIRRIYKDYDENYIDSLIFTFSKQNEGRVSVNAFVDYFNRNVVKKEYFQSVIDDYQKRFDEFDSIKNEIIDDNRVIDTSTLSDKHKSDLIASLYTVFLPNLIAIDNENNKITIKEPVSNLKKTKQIRQISELNAISDVQADVFNELKDFAGRLGFNIYLTDDVNTFVDVISKSIFYQPNDLDSYYKVLATSATKLIPKTLRDELYELIGLGNDNQIENDIYYFIKNAIDNGLLSYNDKPLSQRMKDFLSIGLVGDYVQYYDSLIEQIAFDILDKNSKYYQFKIAKEFKQKGISIDLLKKLPQYYIYKAITDNGGGLDGSAAVRLQGSLFRQGSEDFHDLDFAFKQDNFSWKLYELLSAQFESYKTATNNFQFKDKAIWRAIYEKTKEQADNIFKKTKIYKDLSKYYKDIRVKNVFKSGDSICFTILVDGTSVDLFYAKNVNVQNINDFKVTEFTSAFKAKLQMRRPKDVQDIINFRRFTPVEMNRPYTVSEIREMFYQFNDNVNERQVADKVFDTCERMNLKIVFDNNMSVEERGQYNSKGIIRLNYNFFQDASAVNGYEQSKTIIHELIHAATMYAVSNTKAANESKKHLTLRQKDAVEKITDIYNQIKDNELLKDEYGISNLQEFVAELQNMEFRNKIKKLENNSIWTSIINTIKRFFGLTINNQLSESFNDLIEYNDEAYRAYQRSTYVDLVYEIKEPSYKHALYDFNKRFGDIIKDASYGVINTNKYMKNATQTAREIKSVLSNYFDKSRISVDVSDGVIEDGLPLNVNVNSIKINGIELIEIRDAIRRDEVEEQRRAEIRMATAQYYKEQSEWSKFDEEILKAQEQDTDYDEIDDEQYSRNNEKLDTKTKVQNHELYKQFTRLIRSLGIKLVDDPEELKKVSKNKDLKNIHGWFDSKKNTIYLNPKAVNFNPSKAVHEFTHVWDLIIKQKNSKFWAQGKMLMKQHELWKKIEETDVYGVKWKKDQKDGKLTAELVEDLIASEVHARLVEQYANKVDEKLPEGSLLRKILNWIYDFFKEVRNAFLHWRNEDLESLSIEEFSKMPLKDLLIPNHKLTSAIRKALNIKTKNAKKQMNNVVAVKYLSEATNAESVSYDENAKGISIVDGKITIGSDVEIDQSLSNYITKDQIPQMQRIFKLSNYDTVQEGEAEVVDLDMSLQELYEEYALARTTVKDKIRNDFYDKINNFLDNTSLTTLELNFIKEYITSQLSSLFYKIRNNKEYAKQFSDKDLSQMTYAQIINEIGIQKIIDKLKFGLRKWNNKVQLKEIIDNFPSLLYLSTKKILKLLFVNIQPDFNLMVDNVFSVKSSDTSSIDDVDNDPVEEVEQEELEHYLTKDSFTIDSFTQVDLDMKGLLGSFEDLNSDLSSKESKYGPIQYLNGNEAYQLLSKFMGTCHTIKQMEEMLKTLSENFPWVKYIYNPDGDKLPVIGTENRWDDLNFRNKFFQSFCTSTYVFTSSYTGKNGNNINYINNKSQTSNISYQTLDDFIYKNAEKIFREVFGFESIRYSDDKKYLIIDDLEYNGTIYEDENGNEKRRFDGLKSKIIAKINQIVGDKPEQQSLRNIYKAMVRAKINGDIEKFENAYKVFCDMLYTSDASIVLSALNAVGVNIPLDMLANIVYKNIDFDVSIVKKGQKTFDLLNRLEDELLDYIKKNGLNYNITISDLYSDYRASKEDKNIFTDSLNKDVKNKFLKLALDYASLSFLIDRKLNSEIYKTSFNLFASEIGNLLWNFAKDRVAENGEVKINLSDKLEPFDYQSAAQSFIKKYQNIVLNYQLVFYQDHKLRYALQFPSFLTSMVDDLRGDNSFSMIEYINSLKEKYGDDDYFYDAKTDTWRNNLLSQLTDIDNGYAIRQQLLHLTFGDNDGVAYKKLGKKFFGTYLMHYFDNNNNENFGDYKLSILSDKPVMEFLRLPRKNLRLLLDDYILLNLSSSKSDEDLKKLLDNAFVGADEFFKQYKQYGNWKFNGEKGIRANAESIIKYLKAFCALNPELQFQDDFYNVFLQEVIQIRRALKRHNEGKNHEHYDVKQKQYKNTLELIKDNIGSAASFSYLQFLNDEFENETELGNLIVSYIDGGKIPNYIEFQEKIKKAINEGIHKECRDFIEFAKTNLDEDLINKLINVYKSKDKEIAEGYTEKNMELYSDSLLECALTDYFYNNRLQQININQLSTITPAFYKDAIAFQKRAAQYHAYGQQVNKDATWNGQKVSDGIFRAVIIKDKVNPSRHYEDFLNYFLKITKMQREDLLPAEYKKILNALKEEITETDGQGLMTPSALRKKLIMLNEWSDEKEAIYRDIVLNPDKYNKNSKALTLVLKPLVFGHEHKDGMLTPYQFKNSEYCLMLCDILMNSAEGRPNLTSILYHVSELSYGLTDGKGQEPYDCGIDTFEFESCSKIGNSNVIDFSEEAVINYAKEHKIKDLTLAGIKYLQSFIYKDGKSGEYNTDFVKQLDYNSYKILQKTTPHFSNHEQSDGSQNRLLSISDLDKKEKVNYKGKEVESDELVKRYNEINKQIFYLLAKQFKKHFHLASLIQARQKISEVLKDMISNDSKLDFDLLKTVTIDPETGDFKGDINDPIIVRKLASALLSKVKTGVVKSTYPGGPTVLVSSWVVPDPPKLVFLDENGNPAEKSSDINSFGYYEVYITCPNKQLEKELTKRDGSLMSVEEAIENGIIDKDALTLLATRIPSENKYSTLPCRIKGFLPSTMGEHIICPPELVLFTGSDFDIDKLYCHVHSLYKKNGKWIADNKKGSIGALINEMLDIRFALYSAKGSAKLSFAPGNFNTLKTLNRAVQLAENSKNKVEITRSGILVNGKLQNLNSLDEKIKEINSKNKTKYLTDLDLAYYYDLNLTDTISIFAKSVTDHAAVLQMSSRDVNLPLPFTFGDVSYRNEYQKDKNGKVHIVGNKITVNGNETTLQLDSQFNFYNELISDVLAQGIGASADKAKDPVLFQLNINGKTINVFTTMIRLGFHVNDVVKFLASPAVKAISSIYSGNVQRDNSMLRKLDKKGKFALGKSVYSINSIDLSDDVLDGLWGSRPDMTLAYMFYSMIFEFSKVVDNIGKLTSVNSYARALGKDLKENNEKQAVIENIKSAIDAGWLSTSFKNIVQQIGIPGYIYDAIYGGGFNYSLCSLLFNDFAEKSKVVALIQNLSTKLNLDDDIYNSVYCEMIKDLVIGAIRESIIVPSSYDINTSLDLLDLNIFTIDGQPCDALAKFNDLTSKFTLDDPDSILGFFWSNIILDTDLRDEYDEYDEIVKVIDGYKFRIASQDDYGDYFKNRMSEAVKFLTDVINDERASKGLKREAQEELNLINIIILNSLENYGIKYNNKSLLQAFNSEVKLDKDFIFSRINNLTADKADFDEQFKEFFNVYVLRRIQDNVNSGIQFSSKWMINGNLMNLKDLVINGKNETNEIKIWNPTFVNGITTKELKVERFKNYANELWYFNLNHTMPLAIYFKKTKNDDEDEDSDDFDDEGTDDVRKDILSVYVLTNMTDTHEEGPNFTYRKIYDLKNGFNIRNAFDNSKFDISLPDYSAGERMSTPLDETSDYDQLNNQENDNNENDVSFSRNLAKEIDEANDKFNLCKL